MIWEAHRQGQIRVLVAAFSLPTIFYIVRKQAGLTAARQTLARLLGLPVPDDDGLYPAIDDLYHHLTIGPCSPD